MGKFEETLGINELKSKNNNIWRALLAEFLGNLLLNFFGCASCVALGPPGPNLVLIALTFGLTIFVVVQVSVYKLDYLCYTDTEKRNFSRRDHKRSIGTFHNINGFD